MIRPLDMRIRGGAHGHREKESVTVTHRLTSDTISSTTLKGFRLVLNPRRIFDRKEVE